MKRSSVNYKTTRILILNLVYIAEDNVKAIFNFSKKTPVYVKKVAQ